jgi:hypothetical protein
MSRVAVSRLNKPFGTQSRPISGAYHVAQLFVPAYERGISITITVRQSRNSDARRRLARLFESRRMVS